MADSPIDFIKPERVEKLLDAYIQKAETAFKTRIASQGVVLTGDMLNSFRHYAAERGDGYVQARLSMIGYTRIKDLRSMNYSRTPPLRAIEDFVEKVGVDKFDRVPGYPKSVRPASHTVAVERIAWAIKMHFKKEPNIKRGYRGIYSDPLMTEVLPNLFKDLTEDTSRTALLGVKLLFNHS